MKTLITEVDGLVSLKPVQSISDIGRPIIGRPIIGRPIIGDSDYRRFRLFAIPIIGGYFHTPRICLQP